MRQWSDAHWFELAISGVVLLLALVGGTLTLVVWLLAGRSFSQAILFAMTVVVITCPDALGLARWAGELEPRLVREAA